MLISNKIKQVKILTILICSLFIASCAPANFTRSEKIIYTTNQILQNAKKFRILALESAAEYYKRGLMSEEQKEQIIKLGDDLQRAINIAADALIQYHKFSSNPELLHERMKRFNDVFKRFSDVVLPYIINNK